jgi:hypothetical protein
MAFTKQIKRARRQPSSFMVRRYDARQHVWKGEAIHVSQVEDYCGDEADRRGAAGEIAAS